MNTIKSTDNSLRIKMNRSLTNERGFAPKKYLLLILVLLFLPSVIAVASFAVNSFSCTPSETAINEVFSCTANVKNNGDAAGTVNTATLYTDVNDWLEESNYAQASGTSVSAGQSVEITFSGLRATKSGNNGFSKIMLDDTTDTYVADQNIKENVVNVVVSVSNSESSVAMGGSFDVTAEVTAGGNIDVTLTFVVDSGGCSIGNQASQKTISGMTDGSKQSKTWTAVEQGTSGDCEYTITAVATGTGGVGSKSDSTSSSVTCSNCPTDSGDSSSGSGGGGGGGGTTSTKNLGDLTSAQNVIAGINGKIKFSILSENHTITLKNVTDTHITIDVESEKQTFTLGVGDEINVNLNSDDVSEISIKLKSINVITHQATLVITPLVGSGKEGGGGGVDDGAGAGGEGEKTEEELAKQKLVMWIIIIVVIVLVIGAGIFYWIKKR